MRSFTDRLLQLKGSAAYNLTIDLDVDAVGAYSQCTRAEIVYVLTAVGPEVRAGVGGHSVNGLVDLFVTCCARSIHSDCGRRQCARRNTVLGQSELHGNDPAPNAEDACSVRIDRLLDLRVEFQLGNQKWAE